MAAEDAAEPVIDMLLTVGPEAPAVLEAVLLAQVAAVGRLVTPAGTQMLWAYLMVAVRGEGG